DLTTPPATAQERPAVETPGTPANTAHPHTQTGTKAGPRPLTKAPRRIRAEGHWETTVTYEDLQLCMDTEGNSWEC
ncbi:MAG: hypothetical protein J0I40_07775, partial [Cellulomonas sp.]|nr:hypothetical protein [Cellulomonas sp.]